ncbi:MAG: response regulator transcription factor [Bdellovibrionales bacterium]|nr:response regulator transcription factor [Bdellovibrionales bacterium]
MRSIWIIEDDAKIGKLLSTYLSGFGFQIQLRTGVSPESWAAFFDELKNAAPSLLVIDIMLPGLDGLEICRRIRKSSQFPVILLTARGELPDRVAGLEVGADDYLSKPFEPRELVARIEAVLRRTEKSASAGDSSGIEIIGPFTWSRSKMEVTLNGKAIELTSGEYDLLACLMSDPGKVFSRDELMDRLKGQDFESFDRSIDIAVSRIRQKLGDDPKTSKLIKTIRGKGYVLLKP